MMKVLFKNLSLLTNSYIVGHGGRRQDFTFELQSLENGSLIGHVTHRAHGSGAKDDVGALYYVVAVIFIYSLSILMIIASYIRKNKSDRKLNRYLKEMANLRKREFQMQLYNIAAGKSKKPGQAKSQTGADTNGNNQKDKDQREKRQNKTANLATQKNVVKPGTIHRYDPKNYNLMVLELPPCSYTTDSENETSTEGEYYPSPSHGRLEESAARFTPRKDSLFSNATDPGDVYDSPWHRRSLRLHEPIKDNEGERRRSLVGHYELIRTAETTAGLKVALMRTRSLDTSNEASMALKIIAVASDSSHSSNSNSPNVDIRSKGCRSKLGTTGGQGASSIMSSETSRQDHSERRSKVVRLVIPETEISSTGDQKHESKEDDGVV